MVQAEDWRKSITFSDRIAVISKMQASKPAATTAEASRYAKGEETVTRKQASSLADYNRRCFHIAEQLSETVASSLNLETSEDGIAATDQSSQDVQIGRFTNAAHHKDGLMSDIFRVTDPTAMSIVALKVTNPSMMTAPHDSVREARILTAAKGPNIVPLIETFQQAGGRFVLAFPFMPHDLNTLLQKGTLPKSSQKPLLHALFSALAQLHGQGFLHRDVKPSNILLASPSGPFYLADFGIAWSADDLSSEAADQKYLEVGTTSYRAPELLFGCQTYGPALDLWAAGCVTAQVLRLGAETLFDAGDLGSELALIKSVFETLGTPGAEEWPEADTLPDWGKMNFTKYPGKAWEEILPGISAEARDFVSSLIRFESGQRLEAKMALQHAYFKVDTP